ncbi:MAG: L,D-transpeptidase [Polyangiaceae bacterium]
MPVVEVRGTGPGAWVRISPDGEPEAWLLAREIARPTMAPRPTDVDPDERWIDVELASQTLVAYEGDRAVFATLVSTGRGPQGSETATPRGSNRIWVKLHSSTMDNLERRDDADSADPDADTRLYSLDDVPYVQFFNKAVALHGVFWHRNFGRVQSHGYVNASRPRTRASSLASRARTAGTGGRRSPPRSRRARSSAFGERRYALGARAYELYRREQRTRRRRWIFPSPPTRNPRKFQRPVKTTARCNRGTSPARS